MFVSVVLYCEEVILDAWLQFPQEGKMSGYLVRVLYRLALLSDHLVVFVCAHLSLY